MRIVLAGGTGQLGGVLCREMLAAGHEVVVLSRGADRGHARGARLVHWDARTVGPWAEELDGCDAVVNLAGRSVSCRYTGQNLRAMMDSRVESARAVGAAVAAAASPPAVWLQMSTATIYAHRYDAANDERAGVIGGAEPAVPAYWSFSVEIARQWERAQQRADTPHTRKVALRAAIVMNPDAHGAFDVLRRMARLGLGGPVAGGRQYVSWIHDRDFARAVEFLIDRDDLSGPVNVCSPHPLPQREFMRVLRGTVGRTVGLPATRWMAEIGAVALRTDTELLLKSRRVVPRRLLDAGFAFELPDWPSAAGDLVTRAREDSRRTRATVG